MARDLDIGMKCIKYMLFISNFMFVMVGFLLISIGATINSVYYDFELFMESHHFRPAHLLIAIGILIFFVALFGCVGAIKESTMLINVYGTLLFVLLILEVSAAIAAFVMRSNIYHNIEKNMEDSLDDYRNNTEAQIYWDFMQERLGCCGVELPSDWENKIDNGTTIDLYENKTMVPFSCCKFYQCRENLIYERGCLNRLTYIISESALMLGVGATCVALVELLGVIFAFMLANTIRRVKTNEELQRQEYRQRIYEQLARGQEEKTVTPVLYTPSSTDA
ncbi:hypothetical protein ILUMI_07124 [Ignelater luminosus]|uniref:Tetraspanin n=1 Tax=Ignelater luminosus TaxID=2038154 RepID=A0A8K0GH55_IGNLU|nr:hypothetical protein ILUMI_07124 [Ignelater luminosus]